LLELPTSYILMMYEWEKRKKKKADNEKDNVQQLIVNST